MHLFISDLHLSGQHPEVSELFLKFLDQQAGRAEALYILGDLFEAWLGDDMVLPEYSPVLNALAGLSAQGVDVAVLPGNRDFLLGERFAERVGCRLLDDSTVVDLYGTPTLLMHGDTLCIDDIPYQQMRAQLRAPDWVASFLAKSPNERIAFARQLRDRSRRETSEKSEKIMDVNAGAVEEAFQSFGVRRIIHGHTHRPGHHRLMVDAAPAERIVLGDWGGQGSALACDETGCRLTTVD